MWWSKIRVKRAYKCNYKIIKSQYIICPHCQDLISHKHLISHIRTFHKIPAHDISPELINELNEIKRLATTDLDNTDIYLDQLKKEFDAGLNEGWLTIAPDERISRKKKKS